jgi:hypothetical protein
MTITPKKIEPHDMGILTPAVRGVMVESATGHLYRSRMNWIHASQGACANSTMALRKVKLAETGQTAAASTEDTHEIWHL